MPPEGSLSGRAALQVEQLIPIRGNPIAKRFPFERESAATEAHRGWSGGCIEPRMSKAIASMERCDGQHGRCVCPPRRVAIRDVEHCDSHGSVRRSHASSGTLA